MALNIEAIPTLFTWIKNNFLMFILISISLIVLYGSYEFIDGYAKPLGAKMASQHERLKKAVERFTALDSILSKTLLSLKASRVGLFRFQNSHKDTTKMTYFIVSAANMVSAPGVEIDLPSVTDLPASNFSHVISSLIDHQDVFVYTKDMSESTTKELLLKRGIKAAAFVPIDDLQDNLIGFLEVDWLSKEDIPKDIESMEKMLESDAVRISGYFNANTLQGHTVD